MILKMDGKGNIYDGSTGRPVWTGRPADVLTILRERERLQAEVDRLQADNDQLTEAGIVTCRKMEALQQENHDLRNQLQTAMFKFSELAATRMNGGR